MRTPLLVPGFRAVEDPQESTEPTARSDRQGFRGGRLLLAALLFSIAIWVGLGIGARALMSAL
jgi:hypothetical protein